MARRRRRRSDAGYGYLILGVFLLAALGAVIDFVKTNQEAILNIAVVIAIIGGVVLVVGRVQRAHQRRAEAHEAQRASEARQIEAQRTLEAELAREQARRQYLLVRYNDEQIVNGIMGRRVWKGMTREQLIESWGHPHDIKEELLKTKRKEEFRYNNVGVNRYLSRVNLENDEVVGWKQ